jgi:hypothetical protein
MPSGVFRRQAMHRRVRSRRRSTATLLDMIELPQDAPGSVACGRSGLPLLAICPNGHRRAVPFRLLKTSADDRSPLYGRPFRCRVCDSAELTLFLIDDQAELDEIQRALSGPARPAEAPTTHRARSEPGLCLGPHFSRSSGPRSDGPPPRNRRPPEKDKGA